MVLFQWKYDTPLLHADSRDRSWVYPGNHFYRTESVYRVYACHWVHWWRDQLISVPPQKEGVESRSKHHSIVIFIKIHPQNLTPRTLSISFLHVYTFVCITSSPIHPFEGCFRSCIKNSTISKKALERGLFYFPIFTHMGRPSSHRSYDHDHTTFCRHQPATKRVSLHSGADTRRFARLHQHMYRSIFLNLYSVS